MKKKRLQLLGMAALLLLFVGAFFGLRYYNEEQEKAKAQEPSGTLPLIEEEMDNVVALSYDLEGVEYRFVKEEGTWYCEDDRDLALQQSLVNRMLYSLAPLTAKAKLDDTLDLSEYGLDSPKQTIRMKTAKGEYTLKIGDENELTGDVYLQKDGDNAVYIVNSAVASACSDKTEDLAEQTEEESETEAEM